MTGTIVGSLANSDLAVQNGLTTLSAANTYTGPTFINSSGTLALGISNAIPSNSAVTIGGTFAGGNGGAGTLSTGTFTNAIGSLAFAGDGGTIRLTPTLSQTSTLMLSASGAVNLTGTSTLDLGNTALTASVYRLIAGSSLTGTFASVTGLNSNYILRYGTLNANSVDAQLRANQAATFTMTTGTVTRALVNTNVRVTGTITNSQSQAGAASLTLGLASTGLGGSGFTTGSVAPGASLAVSGTLATGSTVGTQNWTITNTDNSAITTTSTATGSLQVVNQRTFTVSPTAVALGRYLITGSLPTGTAAVTSLGLSATTANAALGAFSTSNGLTLSLTGGSATFDGASASQTAGYTVSGSATTAGLLSGSFSSTVTAELGSIDPVVVNYTANPVNQRIFTTSTSTLSLGFVHQGGSFSSPTLTVTSTGLNATTADATLGSFTGPAGFALNLTSGSTAFLGASGTQSNVYTLSTPSPSLGVISGTFSSAVTAEFGSIPNVTVAVVGQVYSGSSTWATTTSGSHSWGTFSGTGANTFGLNWGTNQGSPGLDGAFTTTDTATFGSALTSGTAVILLNGAAPSLKGITFDNAAGTYDLDAGTGGTGRITLAAGGTNAATIDVLAGFHEIHTELEFDSNLDVSVAASSGLTLHAAMSGSTFALTKTGAGLLTVRGNNNYSGGTLISGGTLALGNSLSPLGSGTVRVINNAALDLRGFTIGNTIDTTNGRLVNPGFVNADITGATTVSSTGAITGIYTITSTGSGTFSSPLGDPAGLGGTVTVQGGGALVTTSTITSAGTVIVNTAAQATLSGPVNGTVTTAGLTTFAAGLESLADVTVSGGTATFAGTTLGDVNVDISGTNTAGATAIFTGTIAKTAHAYASGTITILGSVAATADVKAEAGGLVQIMGSGSFEQATMTNNGLVSVDRTANLTLLTAISGTGTLQKLGSGVLTLTGTSTFSGPTSLVGGSLLVNGSLASGVATLASGTLGGSGSIGGTLSGAGLVSPGSSPGILTAGAFDPTGGLDAAFEFTAFAPNYAQSGTGALNDVLHLTSAAPFAGSTLSPGNVIDIYLNAANVKYLDQFEGGFYADQFTPEQLLSAVSGATYMGWMPSAGPGTRTFNGVNYDPIYLTPGLTKIKVETKAGPTPGSAVTVFIAVPEPGTIVLAGLGLAALVGHSQFRRTRRAKRPS